MGLQPSLSNLKGAARRLKDDAWASGEHRLFTRYILVSGVFGLPASIAMLQLMVWLYGAFVGEHSRLALNAMWIVNFEIGLVRNFLLHCAYTWRTKPTWKRLANMHVAAAGAFVIDFAAFNIVLLMTDVILFAQVIGASSGFLCNFLYNRLRTFGAPEPAADDALTEGSVV